MRRAGVWFTGLALSGLAHLGAGAALMAALTPQEVPDQKRPESRLEVSPESVTESRAAEQVPDSTATAAQDAEGRALAPGAVRTGTAQVAAPPSEQAVPAGTSGESVGNSMSSESVSAAAAPAVSAEAAAPPRGEATAPSALAAPVTVAAPPPVALARVQAPPLAPAQRAAPVMAVTGAARTPPALAVTSAPTPVATSLARPAPAEAVAANPLPAPLQTAAAAPAPQIAAKGQAPEAVVSTAREAPAEVQRAASLPATIPAPQVLVARENLAASVPAAGARVASVAAPTSAAFAGPLPEATAAPRAPVPAALPPGRPEVTTTKAVLAFPDAGGGDIDPASLAAFQSFTQPNAEGSDPLRDSVSAALRLPCARMQVSFDPLTTTLEVTGHVPDPAQRAPVIAALQAQMGSDIAVRDNLLILPAPQCGALSGIAAVGLPQSTDQITNPLIVGDDTHARRFRYIKDDPLVLDLTGPDYPAYVYVDYFDADGNVIHLSPNARAPLRATTPKEQLQIGARRADEEGLMVIIGPPYGQEIAVAFAASVPLYTEERPIVEPAAPYLVWLQAQVAAARAAHPDFKGEWVYFFVQTAAQ
ncbi:MAG: DUF4384 domain-containing protein [Pseudomonadota bacterium]